MSRYSIKTSLVHESSAFIEEDVLVEIFEFLLKEKYSGQRGMDFQLGAISINKGGMVAEVFSNVKLGIAWDEANYLRDKNSLGMRKDISAYLVGRGKTNPTDDFRRSRKIGKFIGKKMEVQNEKIKIKIKDDKIVVRPKKRKSGRS